MIWQKVLSTTKFNLDMVDVEHNQNLAEVTKQSYDDITVAMTIIEQAFQVLFILKTLHFSLCCRFFLVTTHFLIAGGLVFQS